MRILDEAIAGLTDPVIPGAVIFKLYDTYGFPADLTGDIARERNLLLDMPGFESEMSEQRNRARAASKFQGEGVEDFVKSYVSVVQKMIPGYFREGKKYVTIAIGCTGGKHRSVAIAEEIARQLSTSSKDLEITAHATHRDVGRE